MNKREKCKRIDEMISDELSGITDYSILKKHSKTQGERTLFAKIANDELNHYRSLIKLKSKIC